ncbi:MAG: phosphoribosyltransferase family protein [Burkholderiaceae bacterium]|nr:phosphoribosyltransferase family protein [Burkholderiaceae bacterium]
MKSPCHFADRQEAAELLASKLQTYRGRNPLVLAIPRGAVPMAKIIADRLQGELDVVLAHKLGAPFSREYAIGAVVEGGWTYLAPETEAMGISPSYIEREKAQQLDVIHQRRERYTPFRQPINAKGRVVIIVDDGLATGATMIAALHAIRTQNPAELVCAVPVAAPDSLEKVRPLADTVVCLGAPDDFQAVGQFYNHFLQVEDEEVVTLLMPPVGKKADAPASPSP